MNYSTRKIIARIFIVSITITFIFIACDTDKISENKHKMNYYREAQLINIYNNEITSLNTQFITETTQLNSVVEELVLQTTLQNLETVKNQWIKMLKVWKQMELYNLGTISYSFIHFEINRWPSNPNFINKFINGNETINEAFIASKGSSSKGVSGLEYLLFSDSNETILNSFTTTRNFERRLNYLVSTSQNLKTKAKELETLWVSYAPEFISNLKNGTDGSQNKMINAMIGLIEEIIISKLGKPLGDKNGGVISVEKLEAGKSETSLLILKQHLIALERCFTGEFTSTPFQIGFSDYLIQLGYENLTLNIINAFDKCNKTIDNIDTSLKYALENNPQSILELRNHFKSLLFFIKVDMSSAIGSTNIFNDNDGD